jgi:hypothetical protein
LKNALNQAPLKKLRRFCTTNSGWSWVILEEGYILYQHKELRPLSVYVDLEYTELWEPKHLSALEALIKGPTNTDFFGDESSFIQVAMIALWNAKFASVGGYDCANAAKRLDLFMSEVVAQLHAAKHTEMWRRLCVAL